METNIQITLHQFCNEIIEFIDDLKKSRKIEKTSIIFATPKPTEYKFEKGQLSSSYTTINEERREWPKEKVAMLIYLNVKKLSSYPQIVQKLSSFYHKETTQIEFLLGRFAHKIGLLCLDGISNNQIQEFMVVLMKDLNDEDQEFNPIMGVQKIWTDMEEIVLSSGITFRRPKFEELYPSVDLTDSVSSFRESHYVSTQCFIEFTKIAKHENELTEWIEKLLQVLRLYMVGSIKYTTYRTNPNSFRMFGGIISTLDALSGRFEYELKYVEKEKLESLISRLIPSLPGFPENEDYPSYLRVAIDRYNDALLKPFQEEQILSYGVMALEALFLESSGQGELRYKLANRVGKILSFAGKDGILVSSKIKDCYDIRSKFVHGGHTKSHDRTKMYELTNEVMEYTRLSLLIMIQLQKEISKNDCLKLLDESVLSVDVSHKLESLIKSNCLLT